MQNLKDLPLMSKHNTLCDIIRSNVTMIYSGEGCPEGQIDNDNRIKGKVIYVGINTFDFVFESGDQATLTIENFDGLE